MHSPPPERDTTSPPPPRLSHLALPPPASDYEAERGGPVLSLNRALIAPYRALTEPEQGLNYALIQEAERGGPVLTKSIALFLNLMLTKSISRTSLP
jgi:hypothetical protein